MRVFPLIVLAALAASAEPEPKAKPLMDHSAAYPDSYPWERLDSLYARFTEHCDGLKPVLARMREIRETYTDVENKDALMREWTGIAESRGEWLVEENDIRREYTQSIQSAHLTAFSRGLARRGELGLAEKIPPVATHLLFYEKISKEMRDRRDKLVAAYLGEEKALEALRVAHAQAVEGRRKRMLWGVMFIPILIIGAAGTVYGRRRAMPASLPPPAAGALPHLTATLSENFTIERMIGKGGMGEVFEGTDRTLDRKVAIKRMRAELLSSPRELEQFMAEARTVAALKHPNLVEIYSIERDASQVYLVFEFITGKTLHEVIEGRRLSLKEAAYVVKCVASALAYAHSRSVVHRDLKPGNIMLTPEGLVKVMDFGIAFHAKSAISKLTRADAWGTPPFMAPEQEMGGVSSGVDLYALAVCFYQMLTRKLPFNGPNYLAQKREELYAAPSAHAADLPAGVDAFFKKALAADPAARFQTASEFSAAAGSIHA